MLGVILYSINYSGNRLGLKLISSFKLDLKVSGS